MRACPDESLKLDYINGRLSPGKRQDLEHHLAHCPECRLEIEGVRSLIDDFKTVGVLDPSDVLVAATKSALYQAVRADDIEQKREIPIAASKSGRRLRSILTFSAGFAVFAILLMVLLPIYVSVPSLDVLFKIPSSPRLSQESAEFLTNVLGLLPLLLVPSIIVNAGLLLRRKRNGHDRPIHPAKA
jgi:hypothetical protein